MAPAIEIEGLTKVYHTGDGDVRAVDAIDLLVEQGEVFGFLGPNGAGKTTTIHMLLQVIYPTSGTAWMLGKPLGDLESRAQIGYLPELFQFHSFLRAEEFLDFHASLYGMTASAKKERIGEVLELVGLEENRRSRLRTFSKGMLQRIGIAQSIINHPRLLFLDEPCSALDPMGRRDVRDLVLQLKDQGTTVFLNSHMLSEVEMTCARVGIMNKGKLIQVSEMQSLMKPGHLVEIRAEGISKDTMDRIRALATSVEHNDGCLVVSVEQEDLISELARTITDSGATLTGFTPKKVPLEEIFMKVIEESNV